MKITLSSAMSYSLPELLELRDKLIKDQLTLEDSKVYAFLCIEKAINKKKYVNRIKAKKENSVRIKTNKLMNKIKFVNINDNWKIHID